jgi:hypothetical protein
VHALHLRMSELDYAVEPKVECPNNDPNDVSFVWATAIIGGCDAVEEYIVCKMYPLVAGFSFESVTLGTTPLPLFAIENVTVEHTNHVLIEIEVEVERVLGSFRPKEYDALGMANISNGGCLNWVLEQMGGPMLPVGLFCIGKI